MTHRTSTPPAPVPAGIADRVAERSRALGMSTDEVAGRAGMAPRYLRYLMDEDADFDPAGLLRVAAALDMSYRELLHGPSRPPPGQGPAAPHPSLRDLSETEAWDLVDGHGVGRIALADAPAPAVFPVNYTIDAHTVAYRTRPGSPACPNSGEDVSFEVDRIDDHLRAGWSVLITGTAEYVEDQEGQERLAASEVEGPWAGERRPLWVRVRPSAVSGRRVESDGDPHRPGHPGQPENRPG